MSQEADTTNPGAEEVEQQEEEMTYTTQYKQRLAEDAYALDMADEAVEDLQPIDEHELASRRGHMQPSDIAAAVLNNKTVLDDLRVQLQQHLDSMKASIDEHWNRTAGDLVAQFQSLTGDAEDAHEAGHELAKKLAGALRVFDDLQRTIAATTKL